LHNTTTEKTSLSARSGDSHRDHEAIGETKSITETYAKKTYINKGDRSHPLQAVPWGKNR